MAVDPETVILVSGFGRCGTTLTMAILDRLGVPPHDCKAPDYENDRTLDPVANADWLAAAGGKASKLLDPQRHGRMSLPRSRLIWLERDPGEQARSQLKLLKAGNPTFRLSVSERTAIKKLSASYGVDRRRVMRLLKGQPNLEAVLKMRFEDILAAPVVETTKIARFVGMEMSNPANVQAALYAAQAVIPRNPKCLDGFLEAQLLQEAS